MIARLRQMFAERQLLLVLLAILLVGFVLLGGLGVVFLARVQQDAVQRQLREQDELLDVARRIEHEAAGQDIVTLSRCKMAGDWSAYPDNSLSVERVYAFTCGSKTYVILPDQEAR